MFTTSVLTINPIFSSKYIRVFNKINKCEKCVHFFPRQMGVNQIDQCKKFGFISNNVTKEISYDNIIKQRSIGLCGPMGKHFQLRPGNYRDEK
jgi:hypothetical protein